MRLRSWLVRMRARNAATVLSGFLARAAALATVRIARRRRMLGNKKTLRGGFQAKSGRSLKGALIVSLEVLSKLSRHRIYGGARGFAAYELAERASVGREGCALTGAIDNSADRFPTARDCEFNRRCCLQRCVRAGIPVGLHNSQLLIRDGLPFELLEG